MEDVMEAGGDDGATDAEDRDLDLLPEPKAADLTEADFRGCRWIAGEPTPIRPSMFCGCPVSEPGGSWCSAHRERVWRLSKRWGSAA